MKEAFERHLEQDEKNFAEINGKLDRLIIDVVTIKSQWKMVGAAVGIISGIVATLIAGAIG